MTTVILIVTVIPIPYLALGPQTIIVNNSLPLDTLVSTGAMVQFECQLGTIYPTSCNDVHVITYYQLADDKSLIPVIEKTHTCLYSEDAEITIDNNLYTLTVSKMEDKAALLIYRYIFYVHNANVKENQSVLSCHVISNGQIQWQNQAQLYVYPSHEIVNDDYKDILGDVAISIVVVVAVVALSIAGLLLYIKRKKRNRSEADQGKKIS